MSCRFFYPVFGFYTEFGSHLIAVVARHVGIQSFVIAGDRPPCGGGMCEEKGFQTRCFPLAVEESHAEHPFVEYTYGRLVFGAEVFTQAMHRLGCGNAEERGLVIVAVPLVALDAEVLPHLIVERCFLCIEGFEVHQYYRGRTGSSPAAAHISQVQRGCCITMPVLQDGRDCILKIGG